MGNFQHSIQTRKAVLEDLASGMSRVEIAKKHGIHVSTVGKWLKTGVEPRKQGRPPRAKVSASDRRNLSSLLKLAPSINQKMALNLLRNWGAVVATRYLLLILDPEYLVDKKVRFDKRKQFED